MPTQNEQLTALVQRIDTLIETINKRFDDVRLEMKDNMDKYVLTAVHDLEVKRLDGKDQEQEDHLQRLEDRAFSQPQRIAMYISISCSIVFGLVSLFHSFLK